MQPNETRPPGPPDPVPARDARPACPTHQQLKGLLAEQLTAAQRERVETHVEGCPSCQEALARLASGSAVPGSPGTALSAGLLGRLADAPFPDTAVADRGCDSAGPAPAPPLSAPWLSGDRYEVLGELGRGGM